jgi:cellulose synthase/poly-beta-1,6-N-acetylglucosamine synthase-like glycosyltransferase
LVNKRSIFPDPSVSVIIAAHNEENNIVRRIKNLLEQDYPAHKMEIIIVSDGSEDNTANIIENFIKSRKKCKHNEINSDSDTKIELVKVLQRRGKPNALSLGVEKASGDFIVFTDARQEFNREAIKRLLKNFSDDTVGCVSGELIFRHEPYSPSNLEEISLYWRFEKWVRKKESQIHSTPGATGAIYAIRRKDYEEIPPETVLDDVLIPMRQVLRGYRCVFEEEAIAYDFLSKNLKQEKRRKIRTLFGNYQLIGIAPVLLMPWKNPIFFQYFCHKILRLVVPFLLIIMCFTSYLLEGYFYKTYLFAIVIVLATALLHKLFSKVAFIRVISKACRSFVFLNYVALLALFYAIWPFKKNPW